MKLKHVSSFMAGGTPDTANERFWSDEGTPWVSIGDMSAGGEVRTTAKSLSHEGIVDRRLSIGKRGTVLFAMYASVGAVATLGVPATWNQALLGVTPTLDLADSRFIAYWLRHYAPEAVAEARSATQANLNAEQVANFPFPDHTVEEQRRIADFLDDRVSRIDRIIAARREQMERVAESRSRLSYDVVRGATVPGARRDSHLDWLGDIPTTWGVLSVGSQFTVELGKMLDDKRQTGVHSLPYLRNTNVQWDEVSVDDLKEMDIPDTEYARYTVKAGDLLICEGGQPGRGAIWDGRIAPLGFQKALHRARSRGRSLSGWLLECLRVAVELDVFTAASGQTTIAHLTNEQLRGQRFPFPDREVQSRLLDELGRRRGAMTSIIDTLADSIELLTEYKSSLITAAVTGQLDVSTAGSNIPG